MKGKAHVYKRDDINTDEILPARYMIDDKESELAKYAMEDLDKGFLKKIKHGDFVVAYNNFGCGSSREHAVWALRGAGLKAVIAKNFARIYYRNSINNGFLAIECKDVDKINDCDELEIDVEGGKIIDITQKKEFKFIPLPKFAIGLLHKGGLIESIRESIKNKK
jgi:3-isopropylmalate/(R)-2-methylmalate dehydratase small subunit